MEWMCKECSLENLLETWMGTALGISFASWKNVWVFVEDV
jgi:hypothetical protein